MRRKRKMTCNRFLIIPEQQSVMQTNTRKCFISPVSTVDFASFLIPPKQTLPLTVKEKVYANETPH